MTAIAAACGAARPHVRVVKQELTPPPPPPVIARPEDPKLVTLEATPSQALVAAGQPSLLGLRVRIRTTDLPRGESPPVNLALVIDTSSSMEGAPIEDARAAALEAMTQLSDGDRLSLVTFDSTARVLVPSTVLDAQSRRRVARQIAAMKARGTTDMQAGLTLGIQQASGALIKDGINRIVLLSDGVPNDPGSIQAWAQSAGQSGIRITALGLGLEYDETLLTRVAQLSGGAFHYIEQSSQVATVLHDEVLALRRTVARNMVLSFNPGPGIRVVRALGQAAQASGRQMVVSLGELAQGDTRDIYLELALPAHRAGAAVELGDAVLAFDDAAAGAGRLDRHAFALAHASGDATALSRSVDVDVARGFERARASAATVQAIAIARSGNVVQARTVLRQAEHAARTRARQLDDDELGKLADSMKKLDAALPSVAPQPAPQPVPTGGVSRGQGTRPRPIPADAPATVKRAHASAMETLQR